jgi:hypothetical protein
MGQGNKAEHKSEQEHRSEHKPEHCSCLGGSQTCNNQSYRISTARLSENMSNQPLESSLKLRTLEIAICALVSPRLGTSGLVTVQFCHLKWVWQATGMNSVEVPPLYSCPTGQPFDQPGPPGLVSNWSSMPSTGPTGRPFCATSSGLDSRARTALHSVDRPHSVLVVPFGDPGYIGSMTTHPRRRWFRFAFGLRTLFIVMTIFGVWLGWQVKIVQERGRNKAR